MTGRSLLAAEWQVRLLLFPLGTGLFFGYKFMTGALAPHWMTLLPVSLRFRVAC
jgi:hypothetical protein